MTMYSSRRQFIKLGMFFGISVMIGRLPMPMRSKCIRDPVRWTGCRRTARPLPVGRLAQSDRTEDVRAGLRARDLSGWPKEQAHAFFIKATRADRIFEGVDLSLLGPKLQPDRLVLHEELFGDGVTVPQPESLAAGFYGKNFLVPKGRRRL